MKKIAVTTIVMGLIMFLFVPLSIGHAADDIKIREGKIEKISAPADIVKKTPEDIVKNILNFVYYVVGLISVLIIVICGIMIITSDGDAQKVATARRGIIYALVGLLIVVSAFIITGIIQSLGGLE